MLIRADAGFTIGSGHVMRMLALGAEWMRRGGSVTFASASITPALEKKIREQGMAFHALRGGPGTEEDLAQTQLLLKEEETPSLVVLDGYGFRPDFQRALKDRGASVLFVDDLARPDPCHADFVLNQNISAQRELYPEALESTRFLLGPRYALLRKEFAKQASGESQISSPARRILVAFGGSDPNNWSEFAVAALSNLDAEIKVVLGAGNPRSAGSLLSHTCAKIQWIRDPQNLPELIAWADVAVGAAGSMALEFACLGLPSILLVVADNQRAPARALDAEGIAISLGEAEALTPSLLASKTVALLQDTASRSKMSLAGRRAVDGLGCRRVAANLQSSHMSCRPATPEDFLLLWEWANDPVTRAASFSSEPIPWDNHLTWCKEKIASPHCRLFLVGHRTGAPVGQVRFDLDQANVEAIVSLALAPTARGRNLAAPVLLCACETLWQTTSANRIKAYVKSDNHASLKTFSIAGFAAPSDCLVNGSPAKVTIKTRNE